MFKFKPLFPLPQKPWALAQIYTPQLIGNSSWDLFLGTFRKVPGNNAKKFLGTKFIGVAPNCGKEEFPEIPGNKMY